MTEHDRHDADPDGIEPTAGPESDRPALDAELRRLFADDRLTLPVAMHAEDAVLAGAQRRRRRRATGAAAGGVLAAALIAFAGVGLTGLGHSGGTVSAAAPVSSPTLTTRSAPPTTVTTTVDADVLGPAGAGGVFLGEPIEKLIESSKVTGDPVFGEQKTANGCVVVTMLVRPRPPAPGAVTEPVPTTVVESPSVPVTTPPSTSPGTPPSSLSPSAAASLKQRVLTVLVSPKSGVVQIGALGGLRTPEGITLGTPEQQLFRAYQRLAATGRQGELAATTPGGRGETYVFLIGRDGHVAEIWLRSGAAPTCTF